VIGETLDVFRRWLHLPDERAVLAVLGAVAANMLDGDPFWLLLVAPPGYGKTELLMPLASLPDVYEAATLTEASLLSGTPRRETAPDAKGGLLREIGEYGIIVCKDFGSVLSMHRDARASVLAAFREVYDGSWTRHVGTDGGRKLAWQGKVGLLAGCTPVIDRHHGVMASMGERLVLFRLPAPDERMVARRALAHAGKERQMRSELNAAVSGLFAGGVPKKPSEVTADEEERLITLAAFVSRSRSTVERDGYSREIELVPEPEAPTRLVIALDRFLAGLDAIGTERATAWSVVTKAALDCIPSIRATLIRVLQTGGSASTARLSEKIRYPQTTTRRALEDLAAHGVIEKQRRRGGTGDTWTLTARAADAFSTANVAWAAVPEMSPHPALALREGETDPSDVSGTNVEHEAGPMKVEH
jgi:hypothetical protein